LLRVTLPQGWQPLQLQREVQDPCTMLRVTLPQGWQPLQLQRKVQDLCSDKTTSTLHVLQPSMFQNH
jgi:hypothetical protein